LRALTEPTWRSLLAKILSTFLANFEALYRQITPLSQPAAMIPESHSSLLLAPPHTNL
jgi:hypothetical protein